MTGSSNIIASPRHWMNKAVLMKLEAPGAYGVDTVATGTANWIEARNLSITPMDNDKVARNIDLPFMGSSGDIVVTSWTKVSFDVALAGSGTAGTAPKWAPLLQACGMAETIVATTSATYNLVSSGFSSVCAYINIDGVVHALLGGRGTVKGKIAAKGTPMLTFDFDFQYIAPATQALPAVTRTGWAIEEGSNSANTLPISINGISMPFSELDWDHGNKVARIDLPGPQKEILISDRAPTSTVTVLAPDLGTFNPFTLVSSGAVVPVTTTHGSAAGKKVQLNLQARITDVAYAQIENMAGYKLTLQPVPVSGNDEIAITNI